MADMTTEEVNLRSRVGMLECFMERMDIYLDTNSGIAHDSQCHREIKLMLGKTKWGERVIYQKS